MKTDIDIIKLLQLMDIPRIEKLRQIRDYFENKAKAMKKKYNEILPLDANYAERAILKVDYETFIILYGYAMQEYNLVKNE
jgi:hypothetical protein